jgi:hypothetical protein
VHAITLFSEKNKSVNSKGCVRIADYGSFFHHLRLMIITSGIMLLYLSPAITMS